MENIVDIIKSLPNLLPLQKVTENQIKSSELNLGVKFSQEYKEYLANFGAIIADGVELSGISYSEHRDVVALTKNAWELNPKVPHSMYVIEDSRIDGIIVWQDSSGVIYKSLPNQEPAQIADSLSQYLKRLIK